MLRLIFTLALVSTAHAQGIDLLARLSPADIAKCTATNASLFQDPTSKALTFTFAYTAGEPEVRIPVRALGWPTDWSAYRSIQYTFKTTSVETISIGFSDGTLNKAFMTEPLPDIRISGVIPFDAFVQTRVMNPLGPPRIQSLAATSIHF